MLIFQEVLGPQTGFAADADIRHRCAVRLTAVTTTNAKGQALIDPLFDINGAPITSAAQTPMAVTEIQWSSDDALPFAVCVSSKFLDSNGVEQSLTDVSVVYGNVVLADQGISMPSVPLGTVPAPTLFYPPNVAGNRCQPTAKVPFPVRYRPRLPDSPITEAVPLPLAGSPATASAVPLKASGYVSLNDSTAPTGSIFSPRMRTRFTCSLPRRSSCFFLSMRSKQRWPNLHRTHRALSSITTISTWSNGSWPLAGRRIFRTLLTMRDACRRACRPTAMRWPV